LGRLVLQYIVSPVGASGGRDDHQASRGGISRESWAGRKPSSPKHPPTVPREGKLQEAQTSTF